MSNLEILAQSIMTGANKNKKLIKLPPILKNKNNLLEVLEFFVNYYADNSSITLKNANKISFAKVSVSKIHLWMQNLALSLRISFLLDNNCDDFKKIDKAYYFFSKNIPKCPLVLKSATKKYGYISVDNWNKEQFFYCCEKELSNIRCAKELPSYLPKDFYNLAKNEEVAGLIQDIINISESLDVQGKYELSEKLLNSTEKLSERLGYH